MNAADRRSSLVVRERAHGVLPGPGAGSVVPTREAHQRPAHARPRGVLQLALASLAVVTALVLLSGALVLRAADGVLRADGYVTSDPLGVSTSGYALVIDDALLRDGAAAHGLGVRDVGDVRVSASGAGRPVFVGVADTQRVRRYLAGVHTSTLTELFGPDGEPRYREVTGGPPPGSPADLPIWRATSRGRTAHVTASGGDWTVVVMNVDGSAGVAADLRVGATLPVLRHLAGGAVAAGLFLLAAGVLALATARAAPPSARAPREPHPSSESRLADRACQARTASISGR